MGLLSRLEAFTEAQLGNQQVSHIRAPKAIHEAVWGTNLFQAHEVALLDTPLLQRLRRTSQTGLSYLTFPSAQHSRLEHTLGVVVMASRFLQKLKERNPVDPYINENPLKGDLATVRMAALLHDIGHAFCSHVSEEMYGGDADIMALKRQDKYSTAAPHEILSHFIIKTKRFGLYFKEITKEYNVRIDLNTVADMIIGQPPPKVKGEDRTFLTEIINGPFDADKLDYIVRDGRFTGLTLPVDVDRLFYTVSVRKFKDGRQHLVVGTPVPVEHLLFSKMMLHASLYHHQKVRCAEAYLKAFVMKARQDDWRIGGRSLSELLDVLNITNSELLNDLHREREPKSACANMISNLLNRQLPKRAAVIAKCTISNFEECGQYILLKLSKYQPDRLIPVRDAIHARVQELLRDKNGNSQDHAACAPHEILLDFPRVPSLKEAAETWISLDKDSPPVSLHELFPVEGWLKSYGQYRWRGHVFAPEHVRREVFDATKEVFESLKPPIRLNSMSWKLARVPQEEAT